MTSNLAHTAQNCPEQVPEDEFHFSVACTKLFPCRDCGHHARVIMLVIKSVPVRRSSSSFVDGQFGESIHSQFHPKFCGFRVLHVHSISCGRAAGILRPVCGDFSRPGRGVTVHWKDGIWYRSLYTPGKGSLPKYPTTGLEVRRVFPLPYKQLHWQ